MKVRKRKRRGSERRRKRGNGDISYTALKILRSLVRGSVNTLTLVKKGKEKKTER